MTTANFTYLKDITGLNWGNAHGFTMSLKHPDPEKRAGRHAYALDDDKWVAVDDDGDRMTGVSHSWAAFISAWGEIYVVYDDEEDTVSDKDVAAWRKSRPLYRGCMLYFPDALMEVANVSRVANEQHNPGEPIHWAKEKSSDELDALMRHLVHAGKFDTDGLRESAKIAWRALANLQRELDADIRAGHYPDYVV